MVNTPTLNLNIPVLKNTPDMTGLFKGISDTVSNTADYIDKYRKEIKEKNEQDLLRQGNIKIDDHNQNAKVQNMDVLNEAITKAHNIYRDAGNNILDIPQVGAKEKLQVQKLFKDAKTQMAFNSQIGDYLDDIEKHELHHSGEINYAASKAAGLTALKTGKLPIDIGFDEDGNPIAYKIKNPDNPKESIDNPDAKKIVNTVGFGANPLKMFNPINHLKQGKELDLPNDEKIIKKGDSYIKGGDIITAEKDIILAKPEEKTTPIFYQDILKRNTDYSSTIHMDVNTVESNPELYNRLKSDFDRITNPKSTPYNPDPNNPNDKPAPNTYTEDESVIRAHPNFDIYVSARLAAQQNQVEKDYNIDRTKPNQIPEEKTEKAKENKLPKNGSSFNVKTPNDTISHFGYNISSVYDKPVNPKLTVYNYTTGKPEELDGTKSIRIQYLDTENGVVHATKVGSDKNKGDNNGNFLYKEGTNTKPLNDDIKVYRLKEESQNKPAKERTDSDFDIMTIANLRKSPDISGWKYQDKDGFHSVSTGTGKEAEDIAFPVNSESTGEDNSSLIKEAVNKYGIQNKKYFTDKKWLDVIPTLGTSHNEQNPAKNINKTEATSNKEEKTSNNSIGMFMTPSMNKPEGLIEPGNIDLKKQPSVKNSQTGGTSTVWSMSITTDNGAYLLSRVTPEGKIMSEKEAKDYWKKTGKFLGHFKTEDQANAYGEKLHEDYEQGKIIPIKKDLSKYIKK